jgi:hypothetical protein
MYQFEVLYSAISLSGHLHQPSRQELAERVPVLRIYEPVFELEEKRYVLLIDSYFEI